MAFGSPLLSGEDLDSLRVGHCSQAKRAQIRIEGFPGLVEVGGARMPPGARVGYGTLSRASKGPKDLDTNRGAVHS